VQTDEQGHYTALLGANTPEGLPLDLFTTGSARWLVIKPAIACLGELPRILLVGVPYALKAADADTLGGKPPSAYVTTDAGAGVNASGAAQSLGSGSRAGTAAAGTAPAAPNVTGSGTPGYLSGWSTSSNIVNSAVFQSGSGIGIGTKTPAATLDVNGTAKFRQAVTFASGQTFPGAASLGPNNFTGTQTVSGGNVGIGTTGPGTYLQLGGLTPNPSAAVLFGQYQAAAETNLPVIQQTSLNGSSEDLTFGARSTSGNVLFYTGADNGAYNTPMLGTGSNALRMIVTSAGNVGIGTTTPSGGLDVVTGATQLFVGNTANAGLMRFRRPSDGGANGYVGYGWTSQTNDGPLAIVDANGGGEVRLDAYTNSGIVTAYTSNSERLRVDSQGNVGIGTTTPIAKLEVNGTAQFDQPISFASGQTFPGGTFTGSETVQGNVSASGQLISTVAGGTPPLSVSSSTLVPNLNANFLGGFPAGAFASVAGPNVFSSNQSFLASVGIGTSTPTAQLDVAGSDNFGTALQTSTPSPTYPSNFNPTFQTLTGNPGVVLQAGTGPSTDAFEGIYFNAFNAGSQSTRAVIAGRSGGTWGQLSFHTQAGADGVLYERMRIDSTGNVGIGTTAPTAPLDVVGNVKVEGSGNGIIFQDGTKQITAAGGGGGTITGVTAGTGLSGGGTSGTVTLNNTGVLSVGTGTGINSTGGQTPTLSLNTSYTDGRYARLAASNTFSASQTIAANVTITGSGNGITFPDGTKLTTAQRTGCFCTFYCVDGSSSSGWANGGINDCQNNANLYCSGFSRGGTKSFTCP